MAENSACRRHQPRRSQSAKQVRVRSPFQPLTGPARAFDAFKQWMRELNWLERYLTTDGRRVEPTRFCIRVGGAQTRGILEGKASEAERVHCASRQLGYRWARYSARAAAEGLACRLVRRRIVSPT